MSLKDEDGNLIAGDTLTIDSVTTDDAGMYFCVGMNNVEKATGTTLIKNLVI